MYVITCSALEIFTISKMTIYHLMLWLQIKESKRGKWVFFDPCVNAMGVAAMLAVTYEGELLHLWIWSSQLAQSAQSITAAYLSTQ